jgi:hypothetical protein
MKREITIGEALTILVVLLTTLIGWGVSVEVRLATMKTQTEALVEMAEKIDQIHEKVIRHDERLNADLPQVVTRGGVIEKNKRY